MKKREVRKEDEKGDNKVVKDVTGWTVVTRNKRQKKMVREERASSSRTRVSATGAATACEPELLTIHITDGPQKEPEFPIIMAHCCFMQDALGSELFTILDMLNVLGMMAGISVEEKGPATHVVSAVVEHLPAWGRKKVIFRIDGEPAMRALGVAVQHVRSKEIIIECRLKYSSPSMGPVENMNRELRGLARCFRIHFRERKRRWRSRLSLHCCRGWLDTVGWILGTHDSKGVSTHLA